MVLPVLGIRCRANWCDELVSFALWGTVVGGLVGLGLGATLVGIRRLFHLLRVRQLPTVPVCELTAQQVGRAVEIQGRVLSQSPLVGPLSQRKVIGYELEVKTTWRKPRILIRKLVTRTWHERFLTEASVNDGTGTIELDLKDTVFYWYQASATWAPNEAPDWALPQSSLEGYELIRVTAREQYVPHGANVFVLGKLRDEQTLVATVLSVGSEPMTQRALLTEGGISVAMAALSLPLAVWLGNDAFNASLQYLAELNFRTIRDNPILHIVAWVWVPFFAIGMFMMPIRYTQRLGNFVITSTLRRQSYES